MVRKASKFLPQSHQVTKKNKSLLINEHYKMKLCVLVPLWQGPLDAA
jgi:hypothetical protein